MSRGRNRRTRRSNRTRSAWGIAGVAAVAAVAITLTGVAVFNASRPAATHAQVNAAPLMPSATRTVPARLQPADVMGRLDDKTRPFNIVVFGDSTGIASRGWQVLTTERLAQKYDRTAVLHPWDAAKGADAYQTQNWNLAAGTNAPIDVHNASMPGSSSTYPMTRFDKMVPIPGDSVDLVFVNYGHNENLQNRVRDQSALMDEVSTRYPNAAVVSFLQNPERTGTARAAAVRDGNFYWKRWLEGNGYAFVDVQAAFDAQPDLNALLAEDGPYHPNNAGYQIWSDELTKYLAGES